MKFRPVRRSRPPGYPTRVMVLADPRLLRANMPAAWRLNTGLAGAAAVLMALAAPGCSDGSRPGDVRDASLEDAPAGPASTSLMSNPRFRRVVAPIFEHGDGRRPAAGMPEMGIILSPTPEQYEMAAMTEKGGLRVIREELAKVGISLTDEKVIVYHGPSRDPKRAERRREARRTGKSPWIVDLVDPDRRVAVEFISTEDHDYLISRGWGWGGWHYEHLKAARWVNKQFAVEDVDPYLYAVFYDPGGRPDPEKLRAQVRDFVAWLKLNSLD